MMCCCSNKCTEYKIYTFSELFDCNAEVNIQQMMSNVVEVVRNTGVYNFISESDFSNIQNYITTKWLSVVNSLLVIFRQRRFISLENVSDIACMTLSLMRTYLTEKIDSLIIYTLSLNLEKQGSSNIRENIFTVVEEPLRKKISSTHDIMLNNVKNQTSNSEKSSSRDYHKIISDTLALNNEFNNILSDLILIINKVVVDYIPSIHGYFCWYGKE